MASGAITSREFDELLRAVMVYTFRDVTGARIDVRSRHRMDRDAVEFLVEGENEPLVTIDGQTFHHAKTPDIVYVLQEAYRHREEMRAHKRGQLARQRVEAEFVDTAAEEARRCDILRALG